MTTPLTNINSQRRSFSLSSEDYFGAGGASGSTDSRRWLSERLTSAGVSGLASCLCFVTITGTLLFERLDWASFF